MRQKWIFRSLIVLIFLMSTALFTSAQGDLPPDTLQAALYDGSPIIYTFAGNEGEVVTLYAIGSGGLRPTLALASSSGQPIAFANSDPLTPIDSDTRLTAILPRTDTYIVTLSSLDSTVGGFGVFRSVSAAVATSPLTGTIDVNIAPNTNEQAFSIPASTTSQQVSITNLGTSGAFTAQVQAGDGTILVSITGGLDAVTLTIPASANEALITVGAADAALGTDVQLSLLGGSATDTTTTVTTDPNQCVITGNAVNLRGGPGTNYDIVANLGADGQVIATGQNSGWYYGTYNGVTVWVAASVVTATGNCGNLALVDAPPPPVAPAPQTTEEVTDTTQQQATPSPTATMSTDTTQQQATATMPPTATTMPTAIPFEVVSLTCNYVVNDGATVRFNVTGAPNATFRVDVRQGSTTYSVDRTLNNDGFLNGNQRFNQAGNSNYRAYLVYNGQDVADSDC